MQTVNYARYYFPSGLRWTLLVLLLPLALYLFVISWYITGCFCLMVVFITWTSKYVMSVDQDKKLIKDVFYRMSIPFGQTYKELKKLLVTSEKKSYKAASRSRDYWVNYTEYSLHLKYDDKQVTLLTMHDPDPFKVQVKKFAKDLKLSIETT